MEVYSRFSQSCEFGKRGVEILMLFDCCAFKLFFFSGKPQVWIVCFLASVRIPANGKWPWPIDVRAEIMGKAATDVPPDPHCSGRRRAMNCFVLPSRQELRQLRRSTQHSAVSQNQNLSPQGKQRKQGAKGLPLIHADRKGPRIEEVKP
jgi:hypothetical protein